MAEFLRISGKDLGSLALGDHCPRCFWAQRRAPKGIPFQIFPGIFSSIDSFTKKVVHQWFDAIGAPIWLGSLGPLTGYQHPPHFSKFQVRHSGTGVLLTGAPDAIFTKPDGSLIIADYKTAKFTDAQDALLAMYEIQLTAYAYIANGLGWPPVVAIALIYAEPMTELVDAAPQSAGRDHGFVLPFKAIVKPLPLDLTRVDPLLERFRDLVELATAPAGRPGCKDCVKLDGLLSVMSAASPHQNVVREESRFVKAAEDLVTNENEVEALRRAVNELPKTGTSVYKIPGCSPNDDDRYTEPGNFAVIRSKLISAGVQFWDGPDYGKHLIFELDGNSINILCVSADSMAAMAATTALVTRLAEFPEFAAILRGKRERYKIFRVIYAMLNGHDSD